MTMVVKNANQFRIIFSIVPTSIFLVVQIASATEIVWNDFSEQLVIQKTKDPLRTVCAVSRFRDLSSAEDTNRFVST